MASSQARVDVFGVDLLKPRRRRSRASIDQQQDARDGGARRLDSPVVSKDPTAGERFERLAGHLWARLLLALALAVGAVVSVDVEAHPLGNFSINHYSALRLRPDAVDVRYLVDLAEIPTFQELQESGIRPEVGDPGLPAYLARQATALQERLSLAIDGRSASLEVVTTDVIFPPGAGGLPTMKIGVLYRARLREGPGPFALSFEDNTYPGRAGWKEIIAVAHDGVAIASATVPAVDRSRELSDYPTDLLNSPPQDLQARVVFSRTLVPSAPAIAGSGPSPVPTVSRSTAPPRHAQSMPTATSSRLGSVGAPPRDDGPHPSPVPSPTPPALSPNRQTRSDAFTGLIESRQRGLGIALLALAIATGLGAFHALEPGHGKTVVAAYLVGARGTARHAVILGCVVTASHTAGVYALGLITLYASRYVLPERLYPWLGILSGVTIAGLGLVLLWRRTMGGSLEPSHGHAHPHDHGLGHSHVHDHAHDHVDPHVHTHGHAHAHREGAAAGGAPDQAHDHDHVHGHADAQHREHAHGHEDAVAPRCHRDGAGPDAHDHDRRGHGHAHVPAGERISARELFTLGVIGGIIPCPAALVVLLSALSLGRIGFGLLLIAAFSVGLAAVLVGIGLLMVYARRFMSRVRGDGPIVTRWLPLTSAAVMTVLGLAIAVQALGTVTKL
jgi:ABC-type nickel/cobalt efflux system permease component RcnA